MAVSKELVQDYLFYDFKVVLSNLICQAFEDNAVSEYIARHCFQKFRLGGPFVINSSGQPKILDNEALKTAIEESNSQTCGELVKSDETDLHCNREGIKVEQVGSPHIVESQQVIACFSLSSQHCNVPIFD